jgi:hypothetical protein
MAQNKDSSYRGGSKKKTRQGCSRNTKIQGTKKYRGQGGKVKRRKR